MRQPSIGYKKEMHKFCASLFRLSKKLRRIFRASGKQSHNILHRGVYLVQNTSQAASVEYVR